jgi:hypothetical protein
VGALENCAHGVVLGCLSISGFTSARFILSYTDVISVRTAHTPSTSLAWSQGDSGGGVHRRSAAVLGVALRLRGVRRVEAVKVKAKKYQPALKDQATRIWGYQLDETGCFRPLRARLVELIHFSTAVLQLPVVKPRLLQRLVGKWLWVCLLMRPLLSLMRPLFRQSRFPGYRVRLWPSSRAALQTLVDICPLIAVDPARPVGCPRFGCLQSRGWSLRRLSRSS